MEDVFVDQMIKLSEVFFEKQNYPVKELKC